MPKGPLGGKRLSEAPPLVGGECDLSIQDSVRVRRAVDDKLGEKFELSDEDEAELRHGFSRFGTHLGTGSGRMVFALSEECVLKVSTMRTPFQNKSEAMSYSGVLTDRQREMFAPVINSSRDYRWITMARSEREPTSGEFVDASRELVLEHGIDLVDFQKRNFGVVNGSTVVIDYGSGTNLIDEVPGWESREQAWDSIKDSLVFN